MPVCQCKIRCKNEKKIFDILLILNNDELIFIERNEIITHYSLFVFIFITHLFLSVIKNKCNQNVYYCHAKINCIFIIVESNPKENSNPSSSSEVLGSSFQVSSSSSQVISHSISEEVTALFPDKHVHHHDICNTKCFESSKSFCLSLPEKENKKTYKLQHSWLENKMSYCETSNLWRAIFSEGEGLYCYLCRKHDTMNTQNKTKIFNKDPSKKIRPEAFTDHCKTVQHQNAISEMLQKVSFFQKEISEREKVTDEVLVKVFETIYWIIKEELPNCKVRPMLLLLERLGLKEKK